MNIKQDFGNAPKSCFLYEQEINKTQVDIVVILWYNKIDKEKGKFLNIFVGKEQIL